MRIYGNTNTVHHMHVTQEVMNFETCIRHANYVVFGAYIQKQAQSSDNCGDKISQGKKGTICEIPDLIDFVQYTDSGQSVVLF